MIPWTRDLTDTRMIRRDLSRKTNLEDDQCRQLAWGVFFAPPKKKQKEEAEYG